MKIRAFFLCILTTSILAGCASDGNKDAPPPNNTKAEPARATACTDCGKSPASKPVVDGNLVWRQGKELDLTEAKGFANRAQGQKLPLTILVARAQKRDEASGRVDQVDAVKHVVLRPLPIEKIRKNDPLWTDTIRELAKHAAQANAHEAQQIVVSITAREKIRVVQWLNEGIASAGNNQKPDVQVFDAKLEKDTALFYQPLDQKQFN
jgi:hypothetical protein